MEKALVIISDNNKGKFIAKGFSSAFKELSYFVIEKKIYDLNVDEIIKINPHLIFIFWTDMSQQDILNNFLENYSSDSTKIIHCSELKSEIPVQFTSKNNNYCFSGDSSTKKNCFITSINPKEYKTKFNGYKYNITFLGNPAFNNREKLLSLLIHNFGDISLFCRSFDFYKSVDEMYKNKYLDDNFLELYRKSYKGYVESTEEISEIYCSSKINLDIENQNKKNVNYRCLEITSSGGFLIAPYNKKIVKYFDDGKEIETYKSGSDLIDKINFYLRNLNIAQLIASKGKKNTVNNMSFYDRLKSMLKVIYGKNISN